MLKVIATKSQKKPAEQIKSINNGNIHFKYIENPTEEVCWAALKYSPANICFIEHPTGEMVIYAIDSNIDYLNQIADLSGVSEQQWIDFIKSIFYIEDMGFYYRIPNKTEAINLIFLKKAGTGFCSNIINQTETIKWEALKLGANISEIHSPTIEMQKWYINKKNYSVHSIAACPDWEEFFDEIENEIIIKDIIE